MYIRTKDRIVAFGEKYAYPTRLSNGKTYFSFQELTEDRFEIMKEYNHWEILKQADTIEELCDEFVVECFNKSYHAISEIGYDELKHNTQTLSPTDTIYGAIWTSKGLKYVAKMNESGDLELI